MRARDKTGSTYGFPIMDPTMSCHCADAKELYVTYEMNAGRRVREWNAIYIRERNLAGKTGRVSGV